MCVQAKQEKIRQEALEVRRIVEQIEEEEKQKAIEQKEQLEHMIKMQESMVYVGNTPHNER
jgi:ribosomal protein L22